MKKKILSLILTLSVCVSLFSALSLTASAATMVNRTPETPSYTTPARNAEALEARLAELIAKYNNTYWTSTGQPCESHKGNCYSKYYNGWQCNGFARYIFNELFCGGDIGSYEGNELYYLPSPRNAVEVGRVSYFESTDIATVKAILGQAQPGDFFQVRNREHGRPHSMIVTQVTDKGLWILDSNSDGKCGIQYYFHSWEVIAARYNSFSLYHSTKYPAPANPFNDVYKTDWYYNSVLWAVDSGVTSGKNATTFAPKEGCTRAEVVTFLWAANGKPNPKSTRNPFIDVPNNAWYRKAVLWAVEQGITGGTSANTFSPEKACSRAEIVTFLYAAAGKPAVSGNSWFVDVGNTDWFAAPVLWAAQNNITGGIGGGMFAPNYTCDRASVVTFLYKVYGN